MESKRQNDHPDIASYFRSDRVMERDGEWFFYTREGTIEGPFRDRVHLMNRLDTYLNVIASGLLPED